MKSGVVIQGAGAGDDPLIHSIIDGGGIGPVVTADGVDSAAKLDGFKITNGVRSSGGGMYNNKSSPTVSNCIFSGNSASLHGGGMANYSSSSPTVSNCTFSENTANTHGGGMFNNHSSPTVTDCTFSGNSAGAGGGGMRNDWSGSKPTVTNCTFSGNVAYEGGGMSNYSSSPTVTNCTFLNNTAAIGNGGGMHNDGSSPTVTNCILWGDTPEEISDASSSAVVTYSDIQMQGGYPGTGNINADPLFVDPDGPDNIPGNQDDDLHLRSGSPCIDSGTATGAPDTDIEGKPRPLGKGYDMGAYEFQGTTMPWILLLLLGD